MKLLLVATYIFIIIILISFGAIYVSWIKKIKSWTVALFSLCDIIILLSCQVQRWQQIICVALLFPVATLWSSLYEIYKEKRAQVNAYHFFIPANTYLTDHQLGIDVISGARMKSQTELRWDNKLIIMPQPFFSNGEALNVTCIKADTKREIYVCKEVRVQVEKHNVVRLLLVASLVAALLMLPMCLYLSLDAPRMQGYWVTLGEMLLMYLVFGFAKLVLYRKTRDWKVGLLKFIFNIFFSIGLIGVILAVTGIYKK